MNYKRKKPTVFISSTCYDLSQQREDLKEFFENSYDFNTMLSEFDSFPIEPCIGTFENCLNNVDNYADIFILIVGNRYGSVTEQGKSITNLEYLHAKSKNIPIFVFVSNKIHNTLPVWRKNPQSDFSSVTDNSKLFEFVSEIYDNNKWVYTFNSVKDIKITIQNQLALIFSDGLTYRKLIASPQYSILNNDLPSGAIRALTEKPFAWEFKFFAYVLKDEFEKIKSKKWDFKYGIFDNFYSAQEQIELLNFVSDKFNEMQHIVEMLNTLINSTITDALCGNENSCDLEMIIYTSKRIASMYIKLVNWALYFKAVKADNIFSKLLNLLYNSPEPILTELESFVDKIYNTMIKIPDVEDYVERKISLTCTLNFKNIEEISNEIKHLSNILIGCINN